MPEMLRSDPMSLLRSKAFRLALQSAVLSVFGAVAISFFTYYDAISEIKRDLDLTLKNEQLEITADSKDGIRLKGAVQDEIRDEAGTFYTVYSSRGKKLVGNFDIPFSLVLRQHGYKTITHHEDPDLPDRVRAVRGVFKVFPDGDILYIAEKANTLIVLSEFFRQSFVLLVGSILILSLGAGVFVARTALRRINAITVASEEIMAGNLARRISISTALDEFDRLAASLNRMLDRIEILIQNIQHISNDISHDLRLPLSRLKENLEISRMMASGVEMQDRFDEAISQVDSVLRIFSAMLRIAEVESHSVRGHFGSIMISMILEDMVETFKVVASADNKVISSSISPGLEVTGDRELLEQMLTNIIENAILYSPSGSKISIHASYEQGRFVTVEIADQGPGIPESEHKHVFQRFVRLDASRHTSGTGLGLALVAAIAELHDANITLADNRPGLKFRVTIPGRVSHIRGITTQASPRSI